MAQELDVIGLLDLLVAVQIQGRLPRPLRPLTTSLVGDGVEWLPQFLLPVGKLRYGLNFIAAELL